MQLFLDRAQAVQPAFTADAADLGRIAKICRRLDGIPLAIELATGRLEALTLTDLAERLDDRFRLLNSGLRPILPQHKTLSATMDWSYGLLRLDEQVVLRRLAVFSGSFTMEAAEAIAPAGQVPSEAILGALARLVSKSMVVADRTVADIHYRLLETVREYARDRLEEAGESDSTHRRLLAWSCWSATHAAAALRGPNQLGAIKQVAIDGDNYRTALHWAVDHGAGDDALALAAQLWPFWELHGRNREGAQWLAEVLAVTDPDPSHNRASALIGGGVIAYIEDRWEDSRDYLVQALEQGHALEDPGVVGRALHELGELAQLRSDFEAAAQYTKRARPFFERAGDVWGQAASTMLLGNLAMLRGDFAEASRLIDQSLTLARRLGDEGTLATALVYRGLIAVRQGDHQRAVPLFEESLELARRINNQSIVCVSVTSLGVAAGKRGEYRLATTMLEEGLRLSEESGEHMGVAKALLELGIVATYQGDLHRAETLLARALALYREIDSRPPLALCLQALAEVAQSGGDHVRAACHLGAANRLRRQLRVPPSPAQRERGQCIWDMARTAIGDSGFQRAVAEGEAWADREWGETDKSEYQSGEPAASSLPG